MTTSSPSRNLAAIVTGAAQGLGRAIALRLAQDGYDVAVNDIVPKIDDLNAVAEEIRQKGRKAVAIPGDVSNEQDVQSLVDKTVDELGILYIMVANAGIGNTGAAPVVEMTLDAWNRYLSINLTGVFLCYRAAAQQMLKQNSGGRIVGASSLLGKVGFSSQSAYCATKFGVRGLTQAMASELAQKGITVNAYAPGFMDTPLMQAADERHSAMTGRPIGTLAEIIKRDRIPMRRYGTPDNVAALVSYLVSDEADYMTGQSVSINGGIFYD